MNIDTRYSDGRVSLNVSRLKAQRKQVGLSQEKVAEQCLNLGLAVSLSSLKRAELGENVLYRTAANLAKFYSLPMNDLLNHEPPLSKTTPLPPIPLVIKPLLTIVVNTRF